MEQLFGKKNMKIRLMSNDQEYVVEKVGVFTPKPTDINQLNSGEIGLLAVANNPLRLASHFLFGFHGNAG